MAAKREMLRELYEYTKSKARWMGFGIECTTDQTVQYTDFVHIFGNVAQSWMNHGGRVGLSRGRNQEHTSLRR